MEKRKIMKGRIKSGEPFKKDKKKIKNRAKRGEPYCGRDGELDTTHKRDGQNIDNDNILAYVRTINYSPDAMNRIMARQVYLGARGCYLRKDNYLDKLSLFVSKYVSFDEWYEKDLYLYYNTADGGDAYTKDNDFLKFCLIMKNLFVGGPPFPPFKCLIKWYVCISACVFNQRDLLNGYRFFVA